MDQVTKESDLEQQISTLKSQIMQLEMKLRNEKFTNELLEKEIDKKKFKDKMQEGDLKLQIKQLSINLDKEQKQTE
mgnify:CR=1 FL=1